MLENRKTFFEFNSKTYILTLITFTPNSIVRKDELTLCFFAVIT